jgi:hypothetical protein
MASGTITQVLQLIVAFGLFNVWVVRRNKSTAYRGGNATNIVEEFAVYGFSPSFCYAIGLLKIGSAILLILGLVFPKIVAPVAFLVSLLMVGAVTMHAKVGDPIKKAIPATLMLIMSLIIFLG